MNKILELSQKGRTLRRRVAKLAEPEGEWKTINGRHVLVGKGESPLEALNKSLGGGVADKSKHAKVDHDAQSIVNGVFGNKAAYSKRFPASTRKLAEKILKM